LQQVREADEAREAARKHHELMRARDAQLAALLE
jgi:hypothetical protein